MSQPSTYGSARPALEPIPGSVAVGPNVQSSDWVGAWTDAMARAALREGWMLSDSSGSDDGSLQLQRCDSPHDHRSADPTIDFRIPGLKFDADAWALVRGGSEIHHETARQLLARFNPQEFLRAMGVPASTVGAAAGHDFAGAWRPVFHECGVSSRWYVVRTVGAGRSEYLPASVVRSGAPGYADFTAEDRAIAAAELASNADDRNAGKSRADHQGARP